MRILKTIFLTLACVSLLQMLNAQTVGNCKYELRLFDAFGDGWSGASVRLTINEETTSYTLNGENDNGVSRAFDINVANGDTLTISYVKAVNFNLDNSFSLFNPEGIQLFESDSLKNDLPQVSVLYGTRAECPQCLVTNPSSIFIDDVRAFETTLSWNPTDPDGNYVIEYGERGFVPGNGRVKIASGNRTTLTDLTEDTNYEFYLEVNCADGSTSRQIGPYAFKTLFAKNVGVAMVSGPETACGLGRMDSVKIVIQNFGGEPQSLIPLKYRVNGMDASIPIPLDGFYTGVLGKDSTDEVAFETLYDFTMPGEYEILAWTELEEDSDTENDTARITITNIPIITTYPYFEDFETWKGGWTVGPESKASSWEYGSPNGTKVFEAVSGENVWATNLAGMYNASEFSQLVSPCLDFSGLDVDPRMAFSINFSSENCCDEAWIEVSTDGGESWEKVGSSGTGYNWYNNAQENWWAGDGGFDGWVKAYQTLSGTAGASDVRVRFVFSSDFRTEDEGIAIDDVFISNPLSRDAAALELSNTAASTCGEVVDRVEFTFANFGASNINAIELNYQVNGGQVVSQTFNGLGLSPGEQTTQTFSDAFDSSIPGQYEIKAWASLNNDGFARNDTITYRFSTAIELPFGEDFESGLLPVGWTFDDKPVVTTAHKNTSFVLSNNMWSGDNTFEAITPVFGPVLASDSLNFDYRIVNLVGEGEIATVFGAGDQLVVQVSQDCGETFETIYTLNQDNQMPSTALQEVNLSLNNYLGTYVSVRFLATWGTGDYYLDIDNVYIPRCLGSLDLNPSIRNASNAEANNGQISLNPGLGAAPYKYLWNTGDTTSTIRNLTTGIYEVMVIDRFGCTDESTFTIDFSVDIEESISNVELFKLFPNPANNLVQLALELAYPKPVLVQLHDLTGRVVQQVDLGVVGKTTQPIYLDDLSSGMYLLRAKVGEEIIVRKLIKR